MELYLYQIVMSTFKNDIKIHNKYRNKDVKIKTISYNTLTIFRIEKKF